MKRLLRLLYLILGHPIHLHRWLVKRGLAQGWIDDFRIFWDTVRPASLPITDYASYTWLEYFFTQHAREKHPNGDHFEDMDWQYARLLSYVKRREMHPLRMLKVAWTLRRALTVLEFGAGAAPFAHFCQTAWPFRKEVTTSDLPATLLFRYQRWRRFLEHPEGWHYDAIVCTEVFEHLTDPVKTAGQMMDTAWLICFDYVKEPGFNETARREATMHDFSMRGTLTGPDKRGLYVWRR